MVLNEPANLFVDALYEFSDEEILPELSETSESDADDDEEEENATKILQNFGKNQLSGKPYEDSDSEKPHPSEDDEDIGGWGTTKRDYYNADLIETEADALEEENEVRRLQRKQLERFTEEDFGFDELAWVEDDKDDAALDQQGSEDGVIRELLPEPEINDSISSEERLNILRTRYPEFEPLSKELVDLQSTFADLTLTIEAMPHSDALKSAGSVQDHVIQKTPVVVLKHAALRAYLGGLCMYFVLLTSTHKDAGNKITAMSPVKLRDHSIMNTLVQCRQLWEKVKDISFSEIDGFRQEPALISNELSTLDKGSHMQGDILTDFNDGGKSLEKKSRKPRKSKTEEAIKAAEALAAAQRIKQMDENLRAFSALETQIGKHSKSPALRKQSSPSSNHSFGEETTLNDHDALEKSQRRQSLKFYTSQITQKSQKRGAAGRHAGGDTDIPHRERLRDRQARLNAEAENRGNIKHQTKGDDALGGESDDEDRRAAAELRDATKVGEDEDEYYNLTGAQQAEKKADKAAGAGKAAEQGGPLRIAEDEYEGGKRGLSYAIAKNKGLAPRRKKENPRVKKRLKFEEKKRKLGSTRAVWKGGEGRGGYKGELTGIKTGLVRGIKL